MSTIYRGMRPMSVHGCDISQFQGAVNFDQLKTGAGFVIIRAGYTGGIDAQFKHNQAEARRVGIPRGYYWFTYPDRVGNSQADADQFINAVGALQQGEVMVLDYEVSAGSTQYCKDFLDRVQAKTGVRGFLYTNQNRTVTLNWSAVKGAGYPLWVAAFDNKAAANLNTGGWNYPIKQYTADGRMPGIGGAVDLDEFYGDNFNSYGYNGADEMIESIDQLQSLYQRYRGRNAGDGEVNQFLGKASYHDLIELLRQGTEAQEAFQALIVGQVARAAGYDKDSLLVELKNNPTVTQAEVDALAKQADDLEQAIKKVNQ